MDFMRWSLALARPREDGSTERDHYEFAARKGNATAIEALTPPAFPESLAHVWTWWTELNSARPAGDLNGPAAITYVDIDAWARLTDRTPEPYEIDVLMRLDRLYRRPDPVAA